MDKGHFVRLKLWIKAILQHSQPGARVVNQFY